MTPRPPPPPTHSHRSPFTTRCTPTPACTRASPSCALAIVDAVGEAAYFLTCMEAAVLCAHKSRRDDAPTAPVARRGDGDAARVDAERDGAGDARPRRARRRGRRQRRRGRRAGGRRGRRGVVGLAETDGTRVRALPSARRADLARRGAEGRAAATPALAAARDGPPRRRRPRRAEPPRGIRRTRRRRARPTRRARAPPTATRATTAPTSSMTSSTRSRRRSRPRKRSSPSNSWAAIGQARARDARARARALPPCSSPSRARAPLPPRQPAMEHAYVLEKEGLVAAAGLTRRHCTARPPHQTHLSACLRVRGSGSAALAGGRRARSRATVTSASTAPVRSLIPGLFSSCAERRQRARGARARVGAAAQHGDEQRDRAGR